jgi:hypothetical protein
MQKVKLGTEPDHGAERDAIHVAVYPACAAVKVYPGQHVGHGIDGATPKKRPIGIVDPFLNHPIMPGEKFWIVMFPDSARSLRHDWKHPDLDLPIFSTESTPGVAPLSGMGQEVAESSVRYAMLKAVDKTEEEEADDEEGD